MTESARTFSEVWYRVARQCITLRARVTVRRQHYRGELWYVIEDPFNNQFYRLRPAAYRFIVRLRRGRTVEEVWRECLEEDPDGAPGQEDVIQVLAQLYHANLLHYDLPADSEKFFERYRKRVRREQQSRWLNIMFARFPLLDPDAFLRRAMPFVGPLFSRWCGLVWLGAVLWALKLIADNASQFWQQTQRVLSMDNLLLLYVGLVLVKGLHEFGHAFACRRYGGEVHTMGIMLLLFSPVPYVDVTSSWAFRERWKRLLVGGAGMMVEIFTAACATFVWAATGEGGLHNLAYNMIFVASVSTVLFNGNPLLRYDGYYMLSDLLDIPNLYQRSQQHLRHLAERHLFGFRKSVSPTQSRREAAWMTVYGILSAIYRVVVFTGIVFFIGSRFLMAGIAMAVVCVVAWGVVPAGRFVNYLFTSPRLERTRPRALGVSAGIVAVLALVLGVIPFPARFRAPGVLQARQHSEIAAATEGYIDTAPAASGAAVRAGDTLVVLANRELALEMAAARAQLEQAQSQRRRAVHQGSADLEPAERLVGAVQERIRTLEQHSGALRVCAPHEGIWVAPEIGERVGTWAPRGAVLGELVDPRTFEFVAVIPQQQASRLFGGEIRGARVRLRGLTGQALKVVSEQIVPAQQDVLPSAALGVQAGGEVAVSAGDASGLKVAEPFFVVRAEVAGRPGVSLLHGLTGRIRYTLAGEPLLRQWSRQLRQLIQKRYES